jgi:hypothetical protein
LLSLLRNEGGSVGTSLAQTFQERRDQFHVLRLGEYLDPLNAAANTFVTHAKAFFLQQIADPAAAQQLGLQELENLRQQQASNSGWGSCESHPWQIRATKMMTIKSISSVVSATPHRKARGSDVPIDQLDTKK